MTNIGNEFVLKVFRCELTELTQSQYDIFILNYKDILSSGYYVGKKKSGEWVISNKKPENNKKQLANFDELVKQLFTVIE